MNLKIGNYYTAPLDIFNTIKLIHGGVIKIPLSVREFTWKEKDILSLLEYIYFGIHRMNITLFESKFNVSSRKLAKAISKMKPKISPDIISESKNDYYILDGYHRLQSLYLAWHGSFDDKKVYFKIDAPDNEKRFYFFKSNECNSPLFKRLGKVVNTIHPTMWIFDIMNKNRKQFERMFYMRDTINIDIVSISDSFPNELYLDTLDEISDMRIVGDRLRKIISQSENTPELA